jgi:predicted DNA repair protein MutK
MPQPNQSSQSSGSPLGMGCLAFLCAGVGVVIAPILVFAIMLVVAHFDSDCGGAGDEGGCAMGVVAATMVAPFLGLVIGLIVGLAIGLSRKARRQAPRTNTQDR